MRRRAATPTPSPSRHPQRRLALPDTAACKPPDRAIQFRTRVGRSLGILLALLALGNSLSAPSLSAPSPATSGKRIALVIGNARYQNQSPLRNTLNDADDMALLLDDLGFEVETVQDTSRAALADAVTGFIRRLKQAPELALFYYSGHGLQVDGINYLVPVDAELRDALDVPTKTVALNTLLHGLERHGEGSAKLIILDSCRDNPYRSGTKSIGSKGLARADAPTGTLILYATKPGETASDNPSGRNGLFTKHLLTALKQPGLKVEDAFKQVAEQVWRESGKRQQPWPEGVLFGQFYFRAPETDHRLSADTSPQAPIAGAPPPPPTASQGYLQLTTNAPNTRVLQGGKPLATLNPGQVLNLEQPLPAGPLPVEISAPGYQRQQQILSILPNAWAQVHLSLQPTPPAPPETAPEPRQDTAQNQALARANQIPPQLVQQALSDLGHYRGRIDGLIGSQSRAAVSRFQQAKGFPATGTLSADQTVLLIQQAAADGHAESQNTLGMMSAEGIGVSADEAAARKWFAAAAGQRNAFAAYNLAVMYRDGRGGSVSKADARRYLEQAKRGGYPQAAAALATLGH